MFVEDLDWNNCEHTLCMEGGKKSLSEAVMFSQIYEISERTGRNVTKSKLKIQYWNKFCILLIIKRNIQILGTKIKHSEEEEGVGRTWSGEWNGRARGIYQISSHQVIAFVSSLPGL